MLGGENLYAFAPNTQEWVDPLELSNVPGACNSSCDNDPLDWTYHGGKHVQPKNSSWSKIRKATKNCDWQNPLFIKSDNTINDLIATIKQGIKCIYAHEHIQQQWQVSREIFRTQGKLTSRYELDPLGHLKKQITTLNDLEEGGKGKNILTRK